MQIFKGHAARSHKRLTTRSLRDDEIRAIAEATYRDDNTVRFEGVRQAALMFVRTGYAIQRGAQISALAIPPQPIAVGDRIKRISDFGLNARKSGRVNVGREHFCLREIWPC